MAPACCVIIRVVGMIVLIDIASVISSLPRRSVDPELAAELDHCLGALPRGSMTLQAEAELIATTRHHTSSMPIRLGAVVHFGSRLFVASLLSHIRFKIAKCQWRAIACFMVCGYDETPLQFRVGDFDALAFQKRSFPELMGQLLPERDAAVQDHSAPPEAKKERQTCKVLQSEQSLAMILHSPQQGRFVAIKVPLTSPLQVADHCTGESLVQFLEEQNHIAGIDSFRKLFPVNIDSISCDRGSANIRAEGALEESSALQSIARVPLACDAHIVSTSQGYAFKPVQLQVSGMLSFALAQSPGGAAGKFRSVIVRALCNNVHVYDSAPPPPDNPGILHREAVLDAFMPETCPAAKLRRARFRYFLNAGSLWDRSIAWFTLDPSPDILKWAKHVSTILFPAAIPKFTRTRWLTSLGC
jgi:hypothetical protein